MNNAYFDDTTIVGAVQGDGVRTISMDGQGGKDYGLGAHKHQITAVVGTATAGTLAVAVKPFGRSTFETLVDQQTGDPVVIDLSSVETFIFEAKITAWQVTPTGVNGTYGVAVAGWQ